MPDKPVEIFLPRQDALVVHDESLVITPDRKPQIDKFVGWASQWSRIDRVSRDTTDAHNEEILGQLDAIDDPLDRRQFTPVYEAYKSKYLEESRYPDSYPASLRFFLTQVAIKIGDEKALMDLTGLYSGQLTDLRAALKSDERKQIMAEMERMLSASDSETVKSNLFVGLRRFIRRDSHPSTDDQTSDKYQGIFYDQLEAASILARRINQNVNEGEPTIDVLKDKMNGMSRREDLKYAKLCEFFAWRIKDIGVQNPTLRLYAAQALIEFLDQSGRQNLGRPIDDYELATILHESLLPIVKKMDTGMKTALLRYTEGTQISLMGRLFGSPSCLNSYGHALVDMMYEMAATEKDVTDWGQNPVVDDVYYMLDHATRYKPDETGAPVPAFQRRKESSQTYLNLLKKKFSFLHTPPDTYVPTTFVPTP